MMKQKTISSSISCSGIGVHSAEIIDINLKPAPANHGINFIRTDVEPRVEIPAVCENIRSSKNATTIGVNGTEISTVEHLMAAAAGMGIDNLEVEVSGPEVPIMDGSAGPFVEMIRNAGIKELDEPRSWIKITKPLRVKVNGGYSEIRPGATPSVFCSISYDHPLLRYQARKTKLYSNQFEDEIANARTFGFLDNLKQLWEQGLAKGGSLDNALLLNQDGVVNEDGLRWDDECVRHKILDLMGDLALIGKPIMGEITAHKTGHSMNHKLVTELMNNPDCYEVVEANQMVPTIEPLTKPTPMSLQSF